MKLFQKKETKESWNEFLDSPVSEDLEEAERKWLVPQLDKSYEQYGETKMMELTHFDGYAMLDAIEFGAKWMTEQGVSMEITDDTEWDDVDSFVHKYVDDNVIVQIRKKVEELEKKLKEK